MQIKEHVFCIRNNDALVSELQVMFYTSISNEYIISSRFTSNSEALASELLENREEMFPQYHMRSDVLLECSHKRALHVRIGG